MSPYRQHIPGPSPKPYARSPASLPASPTDPAPPSISPDAVHTLALPTPAQYQHAEAAYLRSLTPRRQHKALISQAMFDRIWDVLQHPDAPSETPQFRFWARKMFCLRAAPMPTPTPTPVPASPAQTVLLHDGRLVAVQEQIYALLCYCHAATQHGGRDKTCALLRTHYTWVPKGLIAQFIKACPTCIMKKCGLAPAAPGVPLLPRPFCQPEPAPAPPGDADDQALAALRDFALHIAAQERLEPGARQDGPQPAGLPAPDAPRVLRPAPPGLQSLPMSREVSLCQGLPNGWQYHYNDHAAAHAAFLHQKHGPSQEGSRASDSKRPRIPSIAPLIAARPGSFAAADDAAEDEEDGSSLECCTLPLLMRDGFDRGAEATISPAMHVPQIDPALLAYSQPGSTPRPAIHRPAAPRALGLGALGSQQAIDAFLALRDTGGPSPDSPGGALCAHPMTAESSVSGDSALPTPVDEPGARGDGWEGRRKKAVGTPGEMELVAGVEGLLCTGEGVC